MLYRILVSLAVMSAATVVNAGLSVTPDPTSPLAVGTGSTSVEITLNVDGSGLSGITGPVDTINPFTITVTGPGLSTTVGSDSMIPVGSWGKLPVPGSDPFFTFAPTMATSSFTSFNVLIPDTVDGAVFDVVISSTDVFSDGVEQDTVSGSIGQIVVGVAVPEPSSFLFMGLVGTGLIGFQHYRKRRQGDEAEEVEVAEVA